MKELRLILYMGLIASSNGCDSMNNCINGSCHMSNAKPSCTIGCKDGYAGIFCKENCVYTCHACQRTDPLICTRCEEGKFGKSCDQSCSNCLEENCYINGTCIEGCKSGRKCDSKPTPVEGTGVSTSLLEPTSRCDPPCVQCSDDSTCVQCPGPNGDICKTCGQDGSCLDECGAGCSDTRYSPTESLVGDEPRDIWGQIDHLIKNNVLVLPLLCCGLFLMVIISVGVAWRCRVHKRTQRHDMNTTSAAGIQKESLFGKCGDIYHEIDDSSELASEPPEPPSLEDIPRQHSSREQGQGHSRRMRRHGGHGHTNRGQGHTNRGQGHRHDRGEGKRCQNNISKAEKGNATNQNPFVSNANENQSYITPIQEVARPDVMSTRISNLMYVTPIQEAREQQLDSKTQDLYPEQNKTSEESSYVTAISEAEQRELISKEERCRDVINGPVSAVEVDNGGKCESHQVETGTCTEPEVRDQLETGTCTEPEVRDLLLRSSSDTGEMSEVKLQCHAHGLIPEKSPLLRTGDHDVIKACSQSGCTSSFRSICPATPDIFDFDKCHLDENGYLVARAVTSRV